MTREVGAPSRTRPSGEDPLRFHSSPSPEVEAGALPGVGLSVRLAGREHDRFAKSVRLASGRPKNNGVGGASGLQALWHRVGNKKNP